MQVHDGGSDLSRADLRFDLMLFLMPQSASLLHSTPCPFTPPAQSGDALVRGPYLVAPTVEGITVRWRTLYVGVGRVVVAPTVAGMQLCCGVSRKLWWLSACPRVCRGVNRDCSCSRAAWNAPNWVVLSMSRPSPPRPLPLPHPHHLPVPLQARRPPSWSEADGVRGLTMRQL